MTIKVDIVNEIIGSVDGRIEGINETEGILRGFVADQLNGLSQKSRNILDAV